MTDDMSIQGFFQHVLGEAHAHIFIVIGGTAAVIVVIVLVSFFAYRRWRMTHERLSGSKNQVRPSLIHRLFGPGRSSRSPPLTTSRQTIFVVPDISGYTRFLAANATSPDAAQYVIFELLNSIVAAAGRRLQLAKIQGDAILFFNDVGRNSAESMGKLVIDIFARFYEERDRLAVAASPLYASCNGIDQLDLKIFVHSGTAAHFRFRDTPDVFGTDVIVLHRLMKNNLNLRRYLMVTDAAKGFLRLPTTCKSTATKQTIEGLGNIAAQVYQVDADMTRRLSQEKQRKWYSILPAKWRGTYARIGRSLRRSQANRAKGRISWHLLVAIRLNDRSV